MTAELAPAAANLAEPSAWRRPVSWLPGLMVAAMVTAGDFEYRQRDLTAALEGSADLAILIEMAAYGLVAGLLLLGARAPRGRHLAAPLAAMWSLVAVLSVSSLWAPTKPLGSVRAGQLIVVAALATVLGRRGDRRDLAAVAHVYVLLVTGYIAIGMVWSVAPSNLVAGRFNWAATHPVVAASLLVVSVLLLASWTRAGSGPRFLSPRWAWILLGVHTLALLATQTRGAIFAAAVGVFAWVWAEFDRRRDIALIGVLLLPVVVISSQGVVEALLLRGESVEQLQSLNSRTDLWTEAIRVVGESPWIGRGYFSARELFLDTIGLGGAHNAYVEVLVSAGIIGAATLAVALVRFGVGVHRVGRHPQRPVVIALFAAMLANGLTAQYWAQGGTGASVWFLLLFGWVAMMGRETTGVS